MSNRTATVLSIAAGMLLTAACLAYAAYEFYAPQWKLVAIKGEQKGLEFGNIAGIRSDIQGMPLIAGLKYEWKTGQFQKYQKAEEAFGQKRGNGGPGQLVLFRTIDRSSPRLAQACAQGAQLGDLTLQAGRMSDKDHGVRYILRDVSISSIMLRGPNTPGRLANAGVPPDQPVEEITLHYSNIEWSYLEGRAIKFWDQR
jgi:type VI secretion system Hcp family effector